jgi:putative ABC transport system permease protein
MTLAVLIFSAFRRRPLRVLLTLCGVGIAVGTFLSFLGLSRGLERGWQGVYERSGTDILVAQENVMASAIDETVGDEIARLPGVRAVAALLVELSSVEGRPGVPLTGWHADAFTLKGLAVRGRRFAGGAPEVLMGANAARLLGKEIGDRVQISGEVFQVTGIFESPNVWELESIYLPMERLQRLMGRRGIVTAFHVSVARGRDPATTPSAIQAVANLIKARLPRLAVQGTGEFVRQNAIIAMAQATAWGTSAIALVVATLGVVNTMSMAVLERTREIGLLRAVGWRRRRVLGLLLWESVILTAGGGVLGILFGLAGLRALAQVPTMRLIAIAHLTVDLYLQALVLAIGVGIVGGFLPAYRAARISPVEALRYE